MKKLKKTLILLAIFTTLFLYVVQVGAADSSDFVNLIKLDSFPITADFTFYADPAGTEMYTETHILYNDGTWDSTTYPWNGFWYMGQDGIFKLWGDAYDYAEAVCVIGMPDVDRFYYANWVWPAQTSGFGHSGYVVVTRTAKAAPSNVLSNKHTSLNQTNLSTTWAEMKQ
jgi:hypothetical protein